MFLLFNLISQTCCCFPYVLCLFLFFLGLVLHGPMHSLVYFHFFYGILVLVASIKMEFRFDWSPININCTSPVSSPHDFLYTVFTGFVTPVYYPLSSLVPMLPLLKVHFKSAVSNSRFHYNFLCISNINKIISFRIRDSKLLLKMIFSTNCHQ